MTKCDGAPNEPCTTKLPATCIFIPIINKELLKEGDLLDNPMALCTSCVTKVNTLISYVMFNLMMKIRSGEIT